MSRIKRWITKHPVIAFFILTFAITWGLGFSYTEVIKRNHFTLAPLVFVATTAPALAGIIVSALTSTQPVLKQRRKFWLAFGAGWIISALVFMAHNTLLNRMPLTMILVVLTLVSVLPVAFVLVCAYARNPGVNRYLSPLIRLRGVWGWALLALAFSPLLMLLSMAISHLAGREPFSVPRLPVSGLALVVVVIIKFLYQWFFFNATGEEAGWRGFVQNRLQSKMSPLAALLIMGFFWPIWHFFLWQAEGSPVSSPQWWLSQYAALIPATVFITWFYNRSKGSILVAGVAHASANTAFAFLQNLDLLVFNSAVWVAAIVMILLDRMWKQLPPEHPAVYQTP